MHPRTRHPRARTGTRFRAAQQDTTPACVDWQVFHGWTENDTDFTGIVTVLDDSNAPLVSITWPSPTDTAADHGLHLAGWNRTGPWMTDLNGRRTAPVKTTLDIGTKRPG